MRVKPLIKSCTELCKAQFIYSLFAFTTPNACKSALPRLSEINPYVDNTLLIIDDVTF
jgi:hypothetical protein